MSRLQRNLIALAISIALFPVLASAATGTIINGAPTSTSAWSDYAGWVNWKANNANVTVTDTNLTGFIWAENYGWINLAPSNGGVKNDGAGNLSGSAWGQNTGWIDFAGVTVATSNGIFHGHTTSQPVFGTMTFDCTYCLVRTSWRPGTDSTTTAQ